MIRAKFTVTKSAVSGYSSPNGPHVSKCYKDGKETEVPAREISMSAVYGGSAENKSFAESTPSGSITFTLSNADVSEAFQPGETYYVDFTRAE